MTTLSLALAAVLVHAQLTAAGCDLPMFGGARLFPAASGSTLATADFNQDGALDVVLGGNTGISVSLGNGDGTFQPPVYYPFQSAPNAVVVADFNSDGNPDLAVAGGFGILVMPGNGDGTFQAGIANGASTTAMAVGDFNGDGIPDLAIGSPLRILLGAGDGTFKPPIPLTGADPTSGPIAVGDFNGDGNLDVVTGSTTTTIVLLLGDGKGDLGAPASYGTGAPGRAVNLAVADLNGDHKLDVVASIPDYGKTSVLLGNGSGGFQAGTTYAVSGQSGGLLVADLNGDGVPDLAVVESDTFTSHNYTIDVLPGNGDGTFRPAVQYNPVATPIFALGAGDFNGDGLTDLVFGGPPMGIIFGAADGTFQSPLGLDAGPLPGSPVLADLRGVGVLDLVLVVDSPSGRGVGVFLGNGDGSFQPALRYAAPSGDSYVAVGDFNGDGKPDLAVSNPSGVTGILLVYLGNGDGTFQALFTTVVTNPAQVVVGDFNNDGNLDLSVGGQILLGNGDGTFRVTSATVAAGLQAVDLNGDGNLDMVGIGMGSILVQLGNGDGTFRAPIAYATGTASAATVRPSVAVGDLNGDGNPDLVSVSDATAGTIAVLIGNGDGTFQPAVKYAVAPGSGFVAMGDFIGDGKLDLAAISGAGATVALGNGDGTFRNALTYASGFQPATLAVGDLNGDGKPDLVIADNYINDNIVNINIVSLLNTYIPGNSRSACAPVPPSAN